MKKLKITASLFCTAAGLLLSSPASAQNSAVSAPVIHNAALYLYQPAGLEGKLTLEPLNISGTVLYPALQIVSVSDPEVVEFEEDGSWKTLKQGSVEITWKYIFSSEQEELIQDQKIDLSQVVSSDPQTFVMNVTDHDPVYRLYNPNSGEHFYTLEDNEFLTLEELGWTYEGIAWLSDADEEIPVYRLYNPNAGDHHFTTDAYEKEVLTSLGWNDEGISFYAVSEGESVWRQYNPNAKTGAHNFTLDKNENDTLIGYGWKGEGVAWQTVYFPGIVYGIVNGAQ